ncbi:hypothetical protein [Variovorax sp. CF079]|uniref:hypothetical protein n=1 Tax=Variovorax sp. CF079 TaxID=1882774 RepID=UPI0011133915|nr:hypothetical protein [Variovorax sp. CF079]
MEERTSLPDISTLMQVVDVKRRTAMRKLSHARDMMRHAEGLEREAMAEMQEVEAFQRLMKSVPTTRDEMRSLEAEARENNRWVHTLDGTSRLINASGKVVFERRESGPGLFRTQRDQVGAACFQILSDGSWKTTEELLDELHKRGVQLTAENKLQRLSQILSLNSNFKNQRGRGWALDISPARESSEKKETENEPDPLRMRARQLARDDGNRAR